jgi:hypothetical protein
MGGATTAWCGVKPAIRLGLPLAVALAVAVPALVDGKADWTWADAPRHLMNGVFLHDALRDLPRLFDGGVLAFAERYYAQYPALSLGHHPPLTAVALMPALSLCGVTLFSSQLTMLAIFLVATMLLFVVTARQLGAGAAMWAALLFASHPFIAGFARTTMSEMPAVAMVLVAMLAALRFRESGRERDFVLLVLAAWLTLLARQTAIFVWPAYLWIAWGARPLPAARRTIAIWAAAAIAGVAAIVMATVWYSPFNVDVVLDVLRRPRLATWLDSSASIARGLVGMPLLVAVTVAAIVAAVRRDARLGVMAVWAGSVVLGAVVVTGVIEPARYAVLALPALCIAAASLVGEGRYRVAAAGVLGVVVAAQCWATVTAVPRRSDAYERAAAYVVDRIGSSPATVLYSAAVDTGYFVFFVRALDSRGAVVTLRADKLLTTSFMERSSIRDRVASAAEVYPLLHRYATRFVVIEDATTGSAILDDLRRELDGDRFVERLRLPVEGDSRAVIVYEFPEAPVEPAPDAELHLELPLVDREIRIRLADLRPR